MPKSWESAIKAISEAEHGGNVAGYVRTLIQRSLSRRGYRPKKLVDHTPRFKVTPKKAAKRASATARKRKSRARKRSTVKAERVELNFSPNGQVYSRTHGCEVGSVSRDGSLVMSSKKVSQSAVLAELAKVAAKVRLDRRYKLLMESESDG